MRVALNLLNVNQAEGGGVCVYASRLVETLARIDLQREYILLLFPHNKDLFQHIRRFNFTHLVFQPSETLDMFSRRLRTLRPDVIHYPMTITVPLLDVPGPIVLSFFDLQHEYYPEYFSQQDIETRQKIYKPSVDRATRVITSSEYTIGTLEEKYGTDPEKCVAIPVSIDRDFWKAASDDAIGHVRRKYDLPKNFLIYPANPWPHKNHARLFEALQRLKNDFDLSIPLVLTGRLNSTTIDINSVAGEYGIADSVFDLGYVPERDMPAIYSAATALVFPSLFEGGGSFAMFEAMACGLPMACADATSIPECVGDAAILFDPLQPASIADAIRRVVGDDQLRNELRLHGFTRVRSVDHRHIARRMIEIYDSVALDAAREQFGTLGPDLLAKATKIPA